MLKHKFGADYQALGKRSFETREDLPYVEGMEEDDYWALWERMREGESYDELRTLLVTEGLSKEDIKEVMRWLENQGLRYFPVLQEFKRARAWVYIGLIIMIIGMIIAYQARQNGYGGLIILFPFIAGTVVFGLNWGKFRRFRAELG